MTAPSFTYSGNVYTAAAAGATDFALTSSQGNAIAYLQPAHIHVYKSSNSGSTWTELSRPSQWDLVSGGTVARLATGIANGDWVKIQRITPSSSAYVTFQSSSLLTADQLNDDTLFNTYLNQERYDQGDQSSAVAAAASAAASTATAAATAATATANSALSASAAATTTANAASGAATTALNQSNTALTDSAAALAASASAVTTANTAASNATSAVTTAGTANTNASAAVSTANVAAANAATALSQSNTAITDSSTALTAATAATSNAATALSQSNTAITDSAAALSAANTALTSSASAVTTANAANTKADSAIAAISSSAVFAPVANVAAIPVSPTSGQSIQVSDSTGIESFTPLAGLPGGFVGDSGLAARIQYSGGTWNWFGYVATSPETRYLKLSGGALTGQLRADDSSSTSAPVYSFDNDANTGIAHTGADELALVTGGTSRLVINGTGDLISYGGFSSPGVAVTSFVLINDDAVLAFVDKVNTQYSISIEPASGATADATYVLPATVGTSGQLLGTSGSGALVWTNPINISGKLDITTAASTYAPLANPTFTGTVTIPAGASIAGYLPTSGGALTGNVSFTSTQTFPRIPANSQTTSYTLVVSDAGKHVSITTGGVTVPSGVFATGDVVSIYNNSGTSQAITQGTSVTLRLAGTALTGNRTLDGYGLATLVCVATDTFVIAGAGVS